MFSITSRTLARTTLTLTALATLTLSSAYANEVFANFDPNNVDCPASVVLPPPPAPGFPSFLRAGMPFVLDKDTALERVEMRLTTASVNVSLHANTVGPFGDDQPGTLLVQLHQGALDVSCPNAASFNAGGVELQAGKTYWVVCEGAGAAPTLWNANQFGQTGAFTSALPFVTWNETAVPTPSLRLIAAERKRWHLDNFTFEDGATASGSFAYDADKYEVDILVTTTPGLLPGFTYTETKPNVFPGGWTLSLADDTQDDDLTGDTLFQVNWNKELKNNVDTARAELSSSKEGVCKNSNCTYVEPDANRKVTSGRVIQLGGAWTNHGGSVPGSAGTPLLIGRGQLCENELTTFDLSWAKPGATAFLVAGIAKLNAPFKHGTLVPTPDVIVNLPIDSLNETSLSFPWPEDVPAGVSLFYQAWIPDSGAPAGFAASNALESVSP